MRNLSGLQKRLALYTNPRCQSFPRRQSIESGCCWFHLTDSTGTESFPRRKFFALRSNVKVWKASKINAVRCRIFLGEKRVLHVTQGLTQFLLAVADTPVKTCRDGVSTPSKAGIVDVSRPRPAQEISVKRTSAILLP